MSTVTSIENGFSNSALRIPFRLFWLNCGHCLSDRNVTDAKVGDAFQCERCFAEHALMPMLRDSIQDPAYSHSRARPTGRDRNHRTTYSITLYHRDPTSPSGVTAAGTGPESIVAPLLAELRKGGALSPTESR